MAAVDSLTALEAPIVDRLKARLPQTGSDRVQVLTAADLANITEGQQPSPAVHVVLHSFGAPSNRADGCVAKLPQTWLAVVAVRNLRDGKTGSAARADAGRIAATVTSALMGWRPDGASAPFMLAPPPAAGYGGGFMYLPIALTAEVVVQQIP